MKKVRCALCKKNRVRVKHAALPADLHAALLTCCHLWIPATNDPICGECKNFYREHLRRHDGTSTGYGRFQVSGLTPDTL